MLAGRRRSSVAICIKIDGFSFKTMNLVLKLMYFVLKLMNSVFKMMNLVFKTKTSRDEIRLCAGTAEGGGEDLKI